MGRPTFIDKMTHDKQGTLGTFTAQWLLEGQCGGRDLLRMVYACRSGGAGSIGEGGAVQIADISLLLLFR